MSAEQALRPDQNAEQNNNTCPLVLDYQALFEAAPGLLLVVLPDDPRFTMVAASDAHLRAAGKSREELIGRGMFEVFSDGPDPSHAATVHNLRASFRKVIAAGEPDVMPVQRYDLPRPDGGGMEERYWSPVNSPVLGPDGTVQFLIHRAEEVTEIVCLKRREAEQTELSDQRQLAASALEASEERFRLMADAVPQIVWVTDADGRVEFFNRQWSNYTGAPYVPATATEVAAEFVHPDDALRTIEAFRQAQLRGATFTVEHRIRSAAGEYRWFLVRAEPYRNPGTGELVRWFGASIDIDDRKRGETALQTSEAKYRALFETIDEGFCIIQMLFNQNGEAHDYLFLETNPAFERHTGIAGAQGRTIREFVPNHDEHWFEAYGQVARTGEPVRFTSYAAAMGRFFNVYAFRVGSPAEHKVAVLFNDTTERELLVRQIEAERHRLQQVFAQAPVAIVMFRGRDFVVELANPVYQALLPGRELVGRRFADVMPELGQEVWDVFHRVLDTGEPYVADGWLIPYDSDQDGVVEDHWFNVVYHPFREADGAVSGFIAVLTDVTAAVLAHKELERVNKELEEFAYVASHDLQEPLRMVNIYTQLLLKRFVPDQPDAREYAKLIHDGVSRMETLIRDLLTYSRTVQEEVFSVGSADLSHSLSEAESILGKLIEETGATIIRAPQLPAVRGNTQQLSHVFQNLLSNALKYSRRGVPPRIHISAERAGEQWVISVQDNGIGFEQQYAERIFGLFKRLHTDEYPGTGLGLAICQRIVERYGGRMWAEGKPECGATFYFSLPASEAE